MEGVQQQLSDLHEQATQAIDFMLNDLRQKWKELSGGPSVTEGVKQFVAAVDWSERWIQALLACHLLLFILVVAFRRNSYVQTCVFVGIMPFVYFAERLNALAGQHWRKFAGQNYFDPQGIFASALLSAPLLLIMFTILVNYLITTSVLLIKMKRREIEYRARQRRRAEGSGGQQAAGKQQQQVQQGAGSGNAKKER